MCAKRRYYFRYQYRYIEYRCLISVRGKSRGAYTRSRGTEPRTEAGTNGEEARLAALVRSSHARHYGPRIDTKKSIVIGVRDHRARGSLDTPGVHAPAGGVIGQPTRQQIIANDLPVTLCSYRALYRPEVSLSLPPSSGLNVPPPFPRFRVSLPSRTRPRSSSSRYEV